MPPLQLVPILAKGLLLLTAGLFGVAIYRRYFHPLSPFPGPVLAGITGLYGWYILVAGDEHKKMLRLHEEYGNNPEEAGGPIVRLHPNLLIVSDARMLPQVYPTRAIKTSHYNLSAGHGFKTVVEINDHQEHADRRRILNTPWTMDSMKKIEPYLEKILSSWLHQITKEFATTKKQFDLMKWNQYLSYFVINETLFGQGADAQFENLSDDIKNVCQAIEETFPTLHVWSRLTFLKNLLFNGPWTRFIVPKTTDKGGVGLVLKNRDDAFSARQTKGEKPRAHPDIYDHLLKAQSPDANRRMTPSQMLGELTGIMVAGSDTVPRVFRDFVHQIATSPEVCKKLVAEIDAAAESKGISRDRLVTFDEAQSLTYLDACMRENFRINSNVRSYLPRYASPGTVINGHKIPADVELASCPWITARCKDLYGADAEEYRPERWLEDPEYVKKMEKFNFSFGYGTRLCLGRNLGRMLLYKLAFEFFRRFRIEDIVDGPYVYHHEGLMIRISER
ncbi:cytochrome P450 [Geopyxis carbonaria]|nr:cytochrome P450 [Geopyxis carbonaria]